MSGTPRSQEGNWLPDQGPLEFPLDGAAGEEFPRLSITPKVAEYVRVPFEAGFDVRDVLIMALEQGGLPVDSVLYKVDFASLRKPDADLTRLTELDNGAHREAITSNGFLLYFRGDADADGFNKSWCVWRTPEEAYTATHKPAHLEAMGSVEEMYDWYDVHMHEMWLDRSMPDGYDARLVRRVTAGEPPFSSVSEV